VLVNTPAPAHVRSGTGGPEGGNLKPPSPKGELKDIINSFRDQKIIDRIKAKYMNEDSNGTDLIVPFRAEGLQGTRKKPSLRIRTASNDCLPYEKFSAIYLPAS